MKSGCIYEAQRLLRRANEINPDSAALAVKAMQQLADAGIIQIHAMYYINEALPGASLNKKEREYLCHSQSESMTEEQPVLRSTENQSMLAL